MLTVLLDKGFLPNDITYSHLIQGYAKKDEIQEVLKLYYEMEYKFMSPGLSVFASIIQSLCRCGKLEDAEKYLRIMKGRLLTPNVTIYKILIASYMQRGDNLRALHLHNEMASLELQLTTYLLCQREIKPKPSHTERTICCILESCHTVWNGLTCMHYFSCRVTGNHLKLYRKELLIAWPPVQLQELIYHQSSFLKHFPLHSISHMTFVLFSFELPSFLPRFFTSEEDFIISSSDFLAF